MKPEFILDHDLTRQIIRERPHNLVEFLSEEDKKAYWSNLWKTHLKLETLLQSQGFYSDRKPNSDGDFDYVMDEDIGPYRRLSIEMTEPRMISQSLLETISEFLQQLDEVYTIVIMNDFDTELEIFMIVVTRDKVFGAFETRRMARRFGFDPATGIIKAFSPAGENLEDDPE